MRQYHEQQDQYWGNTKEPTEPPVTYPRINRNLVKTTQQRTNQCNIKLSPKMTGPKKRPEPPSPPSWPIPLPTLVAGGVKPFPWLPAGWVISPILHPPSPSPGQSPTDPQEPSRTFMLLPGDLVQIPPKGIYLLSCCRMESIHIYTYFFKLCAEAVLKKCRI